MRVGWGGPRTLLQKRSTGNCHCREIEKECVKERESRERERAHRDKDKKKKRKQR